MIFQDPVILITLLPAAVFFIRLMRKSLSRRPGILFASNVLLRGLQKTAKLIFLERLVFLRFAAVCLMILALSRPQQIFQESEVKSEGLDIVMAIDCSTSMLAEDFELDGKRRNRVDVVKHVVSDFIRDRRDDRIALVAFAGTAATVCPLTLDHVWVLKSLDRVKAGMLEDGTAIGTGIMMGLNRLKDSEAKSRVMILLTDGRNNAGKISPLTAAEAARALKIKIYTIGAGRKGFVPYPFRDFFGNVVYRNIEIDIDEETLMQVADATEAKSFRARDTRSLRKIYQEINQLEKVPFEEKGYRQAKELFPFFLIPAMILLLLEVILKNTVLRVLP